MSSHPSPQFATTRWTRIVAAGSRSNPEWRTALAELCETYWYPLYAFVRRKGYHAAEAQDATQAFFAELLEKDRLQLADPTRGRFRSFLLTAMQNFLANRARDARTIKRGGQCQTISMDFERGEERYLHEPSYQATPERIFERRWATALLDRTMTQLRDEFAAHEKLALFDRLAPYLGGDSDSTYAQIAEELKMTEGAVKVAAHRLRARCRELLRAEIAQTVSQPEEVDDELQTLFRAVDSQ